MEKMTKKEIIEWLNDLAERARTAYIKSGDDLARKDNNCIMAAIDIIGRADEQRCEAEQGETCRTPASAFDGDVRLLAEFCDLVKRKQQSVKTAPIATPLISCMAPGLRGAIPMAMKAAEQEALEMMLCFSGSYLSWFTPITMVISSPFAGTEGQIERLCNARSYS